MRNLLLGAVATTSLLCASLIAEGAQAAPQSGLMSGVYSAGDGAPTFQAAQFIFSGRNYCWYPGGWQGPGYYWCGYAWRRGFGWGGGAGWNGWHGGGGGWRGAGWRGAGGHGGWQGGGGRGGFAHAGGMHGGAVHGQAVGGHPGGGGGHPGASQHQR
jgi:hypothetical protein